MVLSTLLALESRDVALIGLAVCIALMLLLLVWKPRKRDRIQAPKSLEAQERREAKKEARRAKRRHTSTASLDVGGDLTEGLAVEPVPQHVPEPPEEHVPATLPPGEPTVETPPPFTGEITPPHDPGDPETSYVDATTTEDQASLDVGDEPSLEAPAAVHGNTSVDEMSEPDVARNTGGGTRPSSRVSLFTNEFRSERLSRAVQEQELAVSAGAVEELAAPAVLPKDVAEKNPVFFVLDATQSEDVEQDTYGPLTGDNDGPLAEDPAPEEGAAAGPSRRDVARARRAQRRADREARKQARREAKEETANRKAVEREEARRRKAEEAEARAAEKARLAEERDHERQERAVEKERDRLRRADEKERGRLNTSQDHTAEAQIYTTFDPGSLTPPAVEASDDSSTVSDVPVVEDGQVMSDVVGTNEDLDVPTSEDQPDEAFDDTGLTAEDSELGATQAVYQPEDAPRAELSPREQRRAARAARRAERAAKKEQRAQERRVARELKASGAATAPVDDQLDADPEVVLSQPGDVPREALSPREQRRAEREERRARRAAEKEHAKEQASEPPAPETSTPEAAAASGDSILDHPGDHTEGSEQHSAVLEAAEPPAPVEQADAPRMQTDRERRRAERNERRARRVAEKEEARAERAARKEAAKAQRASTPEIVSELPTSIDEIEKASPAFISSPGAQKAPVDSKRAEREAAKAQKVLERAAKVAKKEQERTERRLRKAAEREAREAAKQAEKERKERRKASGSRFSKKGAEPELIVAEDSPAPVTNFFDQVAPRRHDADPGDSDAHVGETEPVDEHPDQRKDRLLQRAGKVAEREAQLTEKRLRKAAEREAREAEKRRRAQREGRTKLAPWSSKSAPVTAYTEDDSDVGNADPAASAVAAGTVDHTDFDLPEPIPPRRVSA